MPVFFPFGFSPSPYSYPCASPQRMHAPVPLFLHGRFVIASASVIINDITAYICGRLFGRTPLTVLSPKKTR